MAHLKTSTVLLREPQIYSILGVIRRVILTRCTYVSIVLKQQRHHAAWRDGKTKRMYGGVGACTYVQFVS
jgi:hypothetical protein